MQTDWLSQMGKFSGKLWGGAREGTTMVTT